MEKFKRVLKKVLRGAAWCGAFILALIVVLALMPDSKGDGDEELILTDIPVVPPRDNSYGAFLKLEASLRMNAEEEKQVRLCAEDPACKTEALAGVLGRNAEALRRFDNFRGKSFQPPEWSDISKLNYETPIPKILPLSLAASLAISQARWLGSQGRRAEALERLVRVAEAGRSLQSGPAIPLPYMVGLNFRIKALKAMRDVLEGKPALASAVYQDAAARLGGAEDGRAGLKHSLRIEYTMAANMISHMQAGTFGGPGQGSRIIDWIANLYFKRNRTRELLAKDFFRIFRRIDGPCPVTKEPLTQGWIYPQMLRGNLVGVVLHQIGSPNLDNFLNRRCEDESLTEATKLFLTSQSK